MASMEQHLPRCLLQISDGLFGNAILEMSVDATEGKSLVRQVAMLLEGVVSKPAIVAMIVFDLDAMVGRESLESHLALDCLFACQLLHQMNVSHLSVKWSTTTMAALYVCLVNLPFNWAMKPAWVDTM